MSMNNSCSSSVTVTDYYYLILYCYFGKSSVINAIPTDNGFILRDIKIV